MLSAWGAGQDQGALCDCVSEGPSKEIHLRIGNYNRFTIQISEIPYNKLVCVRVLLPRVLDWQLVLLRVVVDGAGVGLGGGVPVTVKLKLMAGTAAHCANTHSSPPHSHCPP